MTSLLMQRLRGIGGVLLKDWRRWNSALDAPGPQYLSLCNRYERVEKSPDGEGFRCAWKWTSELHAPKFMPTLGTRLMKRALRDHPIRRAPSPAGQDDPQVTFIIGHRGAQRLPLLLATLESIAAQQATSVECVVVEQDVAPTVAASLPAWVRHVHQPVKESGSPYSRARAFNAGVRHARSAIVILHDNDMLVPQDYACRVVDRMAQGFDVVNLKRFIFYLDEGDTRALLEEGRSLEDVGAGTIVQNLEGGGSLAITLEAYHAVGGFDERFVGWGGEDVEFWERASTLRLWPYASLPIVHLWHGAQPEKAAADNPNLALLRSLAQVDPKERVKRLRESATSERP